MAKKEKENVVPDSLQKWYDRLESAEARRKKAQDQYGWDRIRQELKGEYKKVLGALKGTPIIPVNLVHAFVRTAIPSLYFRDPKLCVNPRGTKWTSRAKVAEPVINYTWSKLKMKYEIKKVLADTLMFGMGWVKIGMTAVAGPAQPKPKGKGKGAKSADTGTPQYETDQVIKDEKIWAMRVSPEDILFNNDESVDPPYDCRWISHRMFKPTETVKEMFPGNDDLKPTFMCGVQENRRDSQRGTERSFESGSGSIPMTEIYEVTDFDTKTIFYIVRDYHKMLADPKPFPYEFNGFNYSALKFNPVPDEPYPYGDIYAAEPQMWEIMKLLSMALGHVKRFGRQMIVEEGVLSPSEEEKYKMGIDGALIKVKRGTNIPPTPIMYAPVQTDLYNILDRLQMLFDSIVGQSAFERGSTTATKSRTLGEVENIQKGTGTRASEKQDITEDFCEEIATKLFQMKKQFTDVPEFISATGMDPKELNSILKAPTPDMMGNMADSTGFFFTKEDIQGEYDITISAGSMRPLDYDGRNALLMQILRFGGALGLVPNDPASNEVGRELFSNMDMWAVSQAYEEKILASGLQMDIQKLMEQKKSMEQQVLSLQQKGQQMAAMIQRMRPAQMEPVVPGAIMPPSMPSNSGGMIP